MLSRVAERVYWAARYLERAENTARLVTVYASLLLDLPKEAGLGWQQLIDITGSNELFAQSNRRADDRSTVKFLLTDARHPGSILASLGAARENFRTTRDVVPTEGWRCVNELHLHAREQLPRAVSHRKRHEVLSSIVSRCQQLTGLLGDTMSHGPAYQFVRMGRNLERADMTTRIIDVAAATLLSGNEALERFHNTLWMNVLRSLSAYQMYRQYVRRRITGEDVVTFLLKDPYFPRAVYHCLEAIASSVRTLPGRDRPLRRVARLERHVTGADVAALLGPELHQFVDDLQLELGNMHELIATTWFTPDLALRAAS